MYTMVAINIKIGSGQSVHIYVRQMGHFSLEHAGYHAKLREIR